jgi:hypothetical protein
MLSACLLVLWWVVPQDKGEIGPCQDQATTKEAPGGLFKAELRVHTCGWGFGQAAETVTVKVTKLGPDGWHQVFPVEFDSTAEDSGLVPPTMDWSGPNVLTIHVVSKIRSGTLKSHQIGLTVIRDYVPG